MGDISDFEFPGETHRFKKVQLSKVTRDLECEIVISCLVYIRGDLTAFWFNLAVPENVFLLTEERQRQVISM